MKTNTGERKERVLSDLPFSKKVAAAIRNVPLKSAQAKPPPEMTDALKKTFQNLGADYAVDQAEVLAPLKARFEKEFTGHSIGDAFEHGNKILSEIMRDCATFSATIPVALQPSDSQRPEMIGSGVLIRIANRTFLLTAAHVMDRNKDGDLLVPGKNGFMALSGHFSSMKLPFSGSRDDDHLDVAYWWLDDDCVADLHPDCKILERQNVCLEAPPRRTTYTIAGYPWRKSNVLVGRIETQFQTLSGADAKASEYEAAGLNPKLHIAMRFHRKRTFLQRTGRVIRSPLPHGMSGGGVYIWSKEALEAWPVQLPLVGIAHTFIPERSLLIATRLHVYVNCIFHNQPDLAALAAR